MTLYVYIINESVVQIFALIYETVFLDKVPLFHVKRHQDAIITVCVRTQSSYVLFQIILIKGREKGSTDEEAKIILMSVKLLHAALLQKDIWFTA